MAEFTAAATLTAELDESSLRQVRRDIEQGIGDVSVGVDGGGGSGRGMDLSRERNDLLEDIRDLIRGGPGGGGGVAGGGGGGGGGTNIIPIGGVGAASTIASALASIGVLTVGTLTVGAITASALSIQQTRKIDDTTPAGTQAERFQNRLARNRFVEDARAGRLGGGISSREARQAGLRGAFIAGPNRGGGRGGGFSSADIDEIRRSVAAQNNIQVDLSVSAEATVQQIQRALQQSDIQRQIENAITEQVSQPAGGFRNINP